MFLNSLNKKIVVFSDIHQDIGRVKRIINKESPDMTVCLGDWFDSFFYNSTLDLTNTARFLKLFVFNPNCITTWGNHDYSYFYANKHTICSGYSDSKDTLIGEILYPLQNEIKEKFKWYIWIDDYLCSHAGIHPNFLPPKINLNDKIELNKWLTEESEKANIALMTGQSHWFFRAGQARGGNQRIGGLTWLDWSHEFEPIEWLYQIVGHTSGNNIRKHYTNGNLDMFEGDLCIDCHLSEYLVFTNKKLEIKKYIDLI